MNVGYKGKTIIELKDVNTKEVQRVEHENTFQTAVLGELFKPHGSMGTSHIGYGVDQWTWMVGGLLVFDKTIEVGTQYPPQDVNMTANGSYQVVNNADPVELGTWNASESYVTNDELVMTYDFSTSQGNGIINCVCLTSALGGKGGVGNASKTQIPNSEGNNTRPNFIYGGWGLPRPGSGRLFVCTDGVYIYDVSRASAGTLTIKRRWGNITGVDLIKGANSDSYSDVYTINLPSGYDVDTYNLPYQTTGSKFSIVKDNGTNYTAIVVDVANRDVSNEVIVPKRGSIWAIGGTNKLQFAQAYTDNDVNYIGIYDVETGQWVLETVRNVWPDVIFKIGDRYYFEYSSEIWCDCNGEMVPTNFKWLRGSYAAYGTYIPSLNLLQYGDDYSSWDRYIGHPTMYLATINNLEDEIIKDNTKTMKITYVLTRGA